MRRARQNKAWKMIWLEFKMWITTKMRQNVCDQIHPKLNLDSQSSFERVKLTNVSIIWFKLTKVNRTRLSSILLLRVNNRQIWRSEENNPCVSEAFLLCERTSAFGKTMASSSFSDAPNTDSVDPDNKSVTIVINDNGEINYDEKTLQSIIGKFAIFPVLQTNRVVKQVFLNKFVYFRFKPAIGHCNICQSVRQC